MSRAEPLITPEELQCLLGGAPLRSNTHTCKLMVQLPSLHWGCSTLVGQRHFSVCRAHEPRYRQFGGRQPLLWMRGSLKLVCLAVFWGASLHPRGQPLAWASLLVANSTMLRDAMTQLALTG